MSNVRDKVVLVTGGASGIGLATVERLLREGARVMLADLRAEAVDVALGQLRATGAQPPQGRSADVRSAASCEQLVQETVTAFGRLDALVHSAGILRPAGSRPKPMHELEESEYDAVVGTNLKGTFLINRAALKPMLAAKSGQIINISSTSGRKGRAHDAVYSASKAGVIGLSDSIAEEVRSQGIRVQVILPDAIDTPLWKQNGPFPAPGGALVPDRVAELILFLLGMPSDMILENVVVAPLYTKKIRRTP